jgi:hypothetical protein
MGGGVQELIGGSFPTAPISQKDEQNRTDAAALTDEVALTEGVVWIEEKPLPCDIYALKDE